MKNKPVLLIMQSSAQQRGKQQDQVKVSAFLSKTWEMVMYEDLNLHPLGKNTIMVSSSNRAVES